jgi:hypothetical protein
VRKSHPRHGHELLLKVNAVKRGYQEQVGHSLTAAVLTPCSPSRTAHSVHPWHRYIQHDQVRPQLLCFLNGVNAIRRFAANFEAFGLKEKTNNRPNDVIVIRD